MTHIAKNRLKSTWTPLSNEETNNKIFEERMDLIEKWFKHWNDDQRKKAIETVLNKSKIGQLEHARDLVCQKVPVYRDDFTRTLPRVLSLYVMSFLDPRSLCRCAQVSWHWRFLSESDQLWMPKCLRYDWTLPFTPGQFETGVWKRNYIENILSIRAFQTKLPPPMDEPAKKVEDKDADQEKRKLTARPGSAPWRRSDKKPVDIRRYNLLDNDDEVEKIRQLRIKGMTGVNTKALERTPSRVKSGTHSKNTIRTRSKSLTKLSTGEPVTEDGRPEWAARPVTESAELRSSTNAGIRPEPVSRLSPWKKPTPSRRSVDSHNTFPNQGWKVAEAEDSD